MVRGLTLMLDSSVAGPVNLGSQGEQQIIQLVDAVKQVTGSESLIRFCDLPADDPVRRRPVIDRAITELGWQPTVSLLDGLMATSEWLMNATGATQI